MCFHSNDDGSRIDVIETTLVHKFVDEHAVASPFVFDYLWTLCKKKISLKICDACVTWIRRKHITISVKNGLGPTPPAMKVLLPADRLILSILMPGVYRVPESRHVQRYIATLRRNGGVNKFATICPQIVIHTLCQHDICTGDRHTLKSIAVATWNTGRQQSVFGNKVFAKSVRQAGL